MSKTIDIENEAVVPPAAAYLILIHLTPSLLSRSPLFFGLEKARMEQAQAERRGRQEEEREKKTGRREEEI